MIAALFLVTSIILVSILTIDCDLFSDRLFSRRYDLTRQKRLFTPSPCRVVFAILILSLLGCMNAKVMAIEVDDLYQSKVVISNQSRQARNTAQRDAFRKVLVKVSGLYSVLDDSEVKKAVRKAGSYLRQFEYSRNDQNELQLEANFDEAKINQLLRTQSLPIWGKRRPAILLWMAVQDPVNLTRQVVSKESYSQLMSQVESISEERGLPVIFPIYDIEDNEKVSVSDVWGYFYDHIIKFSDRYNVDAIVIARLNQSQEVEDNPVEPAEPGLEQPPQAKKWILQWRLFEGDQLIEVNDVNGQQSETLKLLVDQIADKYAAEYAVNSSDLDDAPRMLLTIKNVGSIEHLIAAEKLLLSFSAVADVMLTQLQQDSAEFEIILVGKALDLLQGLELEQQFEKIYDPLLDKSIKQPNEFKWVP
jgi:hypothetical protein